MFKGQVLDGVVLRALHDWVCLLLGGGVRMTVGGRLTDVKNNCH